MANLKGVLTLKTTCIQLQIQDPGSSVHKAHEQHDECLMYNSQRMAEILFAEHYYYGYNLVIFDTHNQIT